jgi:hypothetical protein
LAEWDSVSSLGDAEAAMADLFWLSDEQWAVLEPFMPTNWPGRRATGG